MSKEILNEMYNLESDDIDSGGFIPSKNILTPKGKLKLLHINGQQYEIVNPAVVFEFEQIIRSLQQQVSLLQADLQQTKSKLDRTRKVLEQTNKELMNKVDYEQ